MLMNIAKAHIDDYEKNMDEVEFVVIDGQSINGTRVVGITIGSKDNGVGEDTVVKTGDKLKVTI